MNYRREIDGLRAVAVVPVILFHAGFQVFQGGFVGVDIFFVISGYLITNILISELERGQFSIASFYERRARRILPALFVVMICCIPFAWLWMLPPQFKEFSQSLVAVVFFVSNILFWQQDGYFAESAELRPMLHTWSLAVEEQYYVLFPLLLMFLWRLGRKRVFWIVGLVALLSLLLSEWASTRYASANFYLAPTRAWELLAGSLCAFVTVGRDIRANNWASLIGLGLILFAILGFDGSMPYPGFHALVPVVGTMLIVLFAAQGTWVAWLLSLRPFVGIGLISYSAYLWHQPLFAFARLRSIGEPPQSLMLLLAVASVVLAFLSWRYVERPFRAGASSWLPQRRSVFAASALVGAAFVGFGALGHVRNGFERTWLDRQPASVRQIYGVQEQAESANIDLYFDRAAFDDGSCRFNVQNLDPEVERRILSCQSQFGPGLAVLGDSHAIDLFGIVERSSRAEFLIGVTKIACHLPTQDTSCHYDEFRSFVISHPDAFRRILFEKAGYLMLRQPDGVSVKEYLDTLPVVEPVTDISPDMQVIDGVAAYLAELARFTPVLWVGPRIEPHMPTKYLLRHGCDFAYELRPGQEDMFRDLDRLLQDFAQDIPGVDYISQNQAFDIRFPRDLLSCDKILWADGNHLSRDGEIEMALRFDLVDYIDATLGGGVGAGERVRLHGM
ncbi:acyltransferase [Rubellimicrobium rubrum]|uniref:Acyltransferase n=1 Tax=Rubellimicrobium rubrum TaxID=2585369 RepID=A0A5C4N0S6_9RHOB|nr:acyltransferase family protein [Rubellimicrobium rubrum]TNC50413.1 acyltransferase [Rubellimicrobium rubrum]